MRPGIQQELKHFDIAAPYRLRDRLGRLIKIGSCIKQQACEIRVRGAAHGTVDRAPLVLVEHLVYARRGVAEFQAGSVYIGSKLDQTLRDSKPRGRRVLFGSTVPAAAEVKQRGPVALSTSAIRKRRIGVEQCQHRLNIRYCSGHMD